MKPRLQPARYTDEDWDIMRAATLRWQFRHGGPFPLARIYVPADRHDADMMLWAAQCPRWVAGPLHPAFRSMRAWWGLSYADVQSALGPIP